MNVTASNRFQYNNRPVLFDRGGAWVGRKPSGLLLFLSLLFISIMSGCAGTTSGGGSTSSTNVNVPTVAITLAPNNATITVASTQQFVADVSGASNTAVTWTVNGAGCAGATCGIISGEGLYTSPANVPSPATVSVKATSVADPTKSASASVTIVAVVSVLLSISPKSAAVPTTGTQLFTASVTGTSNTALSWSLSGAGCSGSACGTLSNSTSSTVYSAPVVAPSPATASVVATSVADPTKSASAVVTIEPTVVVTVTPTNVSVTAGSTQQFAASVTGTSNAAVTWMVSGTRCSGTACGSISSSGLYTAPAAQPSSAIITITATSVSDPASSASAEITIVPPQAAGYSLVWEDTFSALSLCTSNDLGCNWYNPGLWWESAAGTITDPSGTYVDLEWASGQTNNTNISTASPNGADYHSWTYGYFEVSMAFDPTTGSFPAIWMVPVSEIGADTSSNGIAYGELDMFEWQSQTPTTFYGTVHVWANQIDIANNNSSDAWTVPEGTNFANYNTYGVLLTPTAISWYFNNALMETMDTTSSPYNTVFGGEESYFLILSQQAGCKWSGTCAGQVSPLDMQVQWVHIYKSP
jgi:beta-glucanase (GH16 family)